MINGSVLNVRNTLGLLVVQVLMALVVLLIHPGLGNTSISTLTSPLILIMICPNTTDVLFNNDVGDNSSGAMGKLQMPRMSTQQADTVRLLRF
jgi:hypothetical protein